MSKIRFLRALILITVIALAVFLVSSFNQAEAAGTTYNFVFGGGYAAASYTTSSTAHSFTGAGSWYEKYPNPHSKMEMYIDPLTTFGGSFTIDDIDQINYHTLNGATNPANTDFYLVFYTLPCSGGDASWYCHRLIGEPIYANGYVPPTAWVWNTFTTDDGGGTPVNQLTFNDTVRSGTNGFYGAPTLQQIQAGAINWSTYISGGSTTPVDYGSETIKYLSIQTGSGWSSFEGYLDAITISLKNGTSYVIDLEDYTSPVYVDDDWVGSATGAEVAPGKFFGWNAFDKIQDGIDNVTDGGIVHVHDGTYEEQAVISGKALTLTGESLNAVIKAPSTIPTCFSTSSDNKPVVCIKDGADVTLDTLTVDGAGRGNSNYQFMGIAFHNAAGTVKNSLIKDIRDTPFSGAQHGVGIYAYNEDGVSRTIAIQNNSLSGFQKNGMAINGGDTTPLVVNITGNTVTGAGATTVTAQNGIQVWADLGTGSIDGNTVNGIAYDNTLATTKWVASSILNYYADLDITNNIVNNGHVGIYNWIGSGSLSGNQLNIQKVGVYAWGIIATDPPQAVPAPFIEESLARDASASQIKSGPAAPTGTLTITMNNNIVSLSGPDNSSTFGIEADSGYGPEDLVVTANGNTVSGFESAFDWYKGTDDTGAFISITAHQNCLSGNTYGMRSFDPAITVDARDNWWGDASGPYHPTSNPTGTGNEVSDDIHFTPWLDACGGTSTGNFKNVQTGQFYSTLQGAIDDALSGQTVLPVTLGPWPGTTTVNTAGVTINLNNATFTGGSPFLVVNASDVTVQGPGIIDGLSGGVNNVSSAIEVNAGANNFILQDATIQHWLNGVWVKGAVESLKIVSNWIHSNTNHGLLVAAAPTGVVTIEGNLFKVNGGVGVDYTGTGYLTAKYNSWGSVDGPTGASGDGVGSNVIYFPYTFAELYLTMDPSAPSETYLRHVAKTTSFDVAIKAEARKLYGLSFKVVYDNTRLGLNSVTFAWPWTGGPGGNCQPLSGLAPNEIGYRCSLTSGSEWDGGAIATFNFTANNPGNAIFDLMSDSSLSAGAIGGVKVFINNAGYNDPSTPQRDITDVTDGTIIVDDIANFTGFVDLQGRSNDSQASIKIYDTVSGTTLLAQALSASSGKYTSVYEPGKLLVVSTPPTYQVLYYLIVDRALYLPSPVPYVNAMLTSSPTTTLNTIQLLGGDATDNDQIDINDASCIGSAYGTGSNTCSGGPGANSDVNGDGIVNIYDLTLMGGNYGLSTSPWVPQ